MIFRGVGGRGAGVGLCFFSWCCGAWGILQVNLTWVVVAVMVMTTMMLLIFDDDDTDHIDGNQGVDDE